MKKMMFLLLFCLLGFSLSACFGNSDSDKKTDKEDENEESETYRYSDFSNREKNKILDCLGTTLPFLPTDDYEVESSSEVVIITYYGNTKKEFDAYCNNLERNGYTCVAANNSSSEIYGCTYQNDLITIEMYLSEIDGQNVISMLVYPNGGNADNDTATNEVYDGSEVTITFYHTMGRNLREVLDYYILKFNEMYPNIHIEHAQVGTYDEVRTQISTELTAGEGPHLAYCYPHDVAMYNDANAVQTLDAFINSTLEVTKADGTKEFLGLTAAQKADFIPGFYAEGAQFGDGKMYSLPFSKSTEVLYYNKTFFNNYNISVPDHWFSTGPNDTTSLEDVCRQIKAIDPNCIPLGCDSESNLFITMCEQLGSPYTSATGDNFLFNNDTNKSFCKQFRTWYKEALMTTQELLGTYSSSLFTSTTDLKSYMSIGSSAGATYQRPRPIDGAYPFEVGIAPIPQMDANNPKVISQGPNLCMFKKDDPQEMAATWLFMKFLTTNVELQANFSMESGYVPVIESVIELHNYAKWLASANGGDNIAALSAKQCLAQKDYYFTSPAFVGSSIARQEVGLLLTKILAASGDVNSIVDNAFNLAIENCRFYQ